MDNEIILGQSIDYAVESDRHQHCSLSAQGVIALLKISPLSIFETTPPLTESGIFFIFPQFVILIAHLTPGWCFKNLSDCRDASVRPEIVSLGYFFRCWLILHVSTTEVVRLCNVYLVRCSRWHVCKIAYRLLSQELRWERVFWTMKYNMISLRLN